MSSFWITLRTYLNFSLKLRAYIHNTVTEAEVRQTILEQLTNREENFLKLLKNNVFDYPKSPYLALLKAGQLAYEDVEKMVTEKGLENTLEDLYDAGVYVTFSAPCPSRISNRGCCDNPPRKTVCDQPR